MCCRVLESVVSIDLANGREGVPDRQRISSTPPGDPRDAPARAQYDDGGEIRMSKAEGNDECRMTKSERMTKPKCPNCQRIVQAQFDIRASDFFCHLAFDIRHLAFGFPLGSFRRR
jgi:hypothetical protein